MFRIAYFGHLSLNQFKQRFKEFQRKTDTFGIIELWVEDGTVYILYSEVVGFLYSRDLLQELT